MLLDHIEVLEMHLLVINSMTTSEAILPIYFAKYTVSNAIKGTFSIM